MIPIRQGCIVESEEEYDVLRRESKRTVSIRCFVFVVFILMFLIASIAISAVIGDSDEAFLVFYIMYIIAAVISLALISIVLFSVYDKKDLTSGSFRFAMRAPLCTTISVLSALSGVAFYGFAGLLDCGMESAGARICLPFFVCVRDIRFHTVCVYDDMAGTLEKAVGAYSAQALRERGARNG